MNEVNQYDYCTSCLWRDGCSEYPDPEDWATTGGECLYYTTYTDSTDEMEWDEDERSYFDELAYRQRIYASIIYEME